MPRLLTNPLGGSPRGTAAAPARDGDVPVPKRWRPASTLDYAAGLPAMSASSEAA
ncbi:hypothetical protein I553_9319 [Mycobacterium xenopi 4042]|uniref:Uncharacterized protein n=1 Tax=Mycobacterium xenopi 4042 TaxID=1299334 RepID=X8DZP6_MYCXE|nr:hypothetical protein I552_1352 [Mycobacterium xenopi 3993]EUA73163.1 hypothetical protein I553_9319 [Mycobacterium xenopi 4042]